MLTLASGLTCTSLCLSSLRHHAVIESQWLAIGHVDEAGMRVVHFDFNIVDPGTLESFTRRPYDGQGSERRMMVVLYVHVVDHFYQSLHP